jgi:lipopolysaccharide cholinephosphotransferase
MLKRNLDNQSKDKLIELTPERIKKLQSKSLEILLYFKDFCERHGLTFYFCGGCCIGAIRNKGFIPWDDDIDVFMPREDYEKLGELWSEYADTGKYSCNRTTESNFFGNIMTTVTDNGTNVIRPWQEGKDGHKGVMMDVLPLDGCAPAGIKRKIQMMWSMIFSLYCSRVVPVNHGKVVAAACKVLLAVVPSDKLKYKICKFAEKQMSRYKISDCKYITELCAGPHYMKNEYPKEIFEKAVYKEFEGYMMPLPVGYDTYLKIAFGDYMSLPPKEEQVPHHDIVYMDF